MNALISCNITGPENVLSDCAQFTIDDTGSPFVLSEVMQTGVRYTFSFWAKSSITSKIIAAGHIFDTNSSWQKYSAVFTSTSNHLSIKFGNNGTFYIYHPKLEIGNMATDWSPAPEDLDPSEELAETDARIQNIYKATSELDIRLNSIIGTVSESTTKINELTGDITTVNNHIASLELTSKNFTVELQNVVDNGAKKVTTTTGTFDNEGLTIDKSDSTTKSQLTPDGLTVYKKTANSVQDEVLVATSDGVTATNLHANTYLIVGGRSRFENYGTNRTGCFWIGG